jgi:hypothetical protein
MRLAEHAEHVASLRNVCIILVGKPEDKGHFCKNLYIVNSKEFSGQ